VGDVDPNGGGGVTVGEAGSGGRCSASGTSWEWL